MTAKEQKRILLLAPELLGESLALQLSTQEPELKIALSKDELKGPPLLIIWSIEIFESSPSIQNEIRNIKKRWNQCPLLVLLPNRITISTDELLKWETEGMIQDPDLNILKESIYTILDGGRVIRLKDEIRSRDINYKLKARKSILLNSLDIINNELNSLTSLLTPKPRNPILIFSIKARTRELQASKDFLIWLWSPFHKSLPNTELILKSKKGSNNDEYGTSINIMEKNSKAVWETISTRLSAAINNDLVNTTGDLFAFEGLNKFKRQELVNSLLNQLNTVFDNLYHLKDTDNSTIEKWNSLQLQLRQHALRDLAGSYESIIINEQSVPIADQLLKNADLTSIDPELPSSDIIIDCLINDKPLLLDGQYLPTDDPRSLINLESLISNWIIRTTEIISSEIINICSLIPELRSYLLSNKYISTRELERLRNQLNSQNRIYNLFKRPVHLYESKRLLYTLNKGKILSELITEPRDHELRYLGWWQKQVAFAVEARDALAPQLQSMVQYLGDLMVVLLTNVLGRAIGLVGKGIAQGMGRTISR